MKSQIAAPTKDLTEREQGFAITACQGAQCSLGNNVRQLQAIK